MEIVLLEDVKALGKKGQVVKVNDGYARNFILPKKLGVEATAKNLNDLKLQKANDAKVAAEQLAAAKELGEKIEKSKVVVSIKAGEGGRAFGAVSSKEIAKAAADQLGLDIDKKKIVLNDPIKAIGSFEVAVKLHKEVTAKLAVKVVEASKGRKGGGVSYSGRKGCAVLFSQASGQKIPERRFGKYYSRRKESWKKP